MKENAALTAILEAVIFWTNDKKDLSSVENKQCLSFIGCPSSSGFYKKNTLNMVCATLIYNKTKMGHTALNTKRCTFLPIYNAHIIMCKIFINISKVY